MGIEYKLSQCWYAYLYGRELYNLIKLTNYQLQSISWTSLRVSVPHDVMFLRETGSLKLWMNNY